MSHIVQDENIDIMDSRSDNDNVINKFDEESILNSADETNDVLVVEEKEKTDQSDNIDVDTSSQMPKRKLKIARPKSVQHSRASKAQRTRPSTVHSKTGLARERSKFLKAEKREQKIDNDLAKKEKKRGQAAMEKLDMETRSGIIHGNAKRAFYNKLKNKLSEKNKVDVYNALLILEVLSDDVDNHFDILQYRLLQYAADFINSSKTWSLQMWKHIHSVTISMKNLLQASTRRGYSGGNNGLIYKQNGLSVLVRAACADLFSPLNQIKYNNNEADTFLPQWKNNNMKNNKHNDGSNIGMKPSRRIGGHKLAKASPLLSRYILRAQRVAFQSLDILAKLPKNRPALIRSRVLEVAILVMGGRNKQLQKLKKIKLTQGVPRFEGTPSQLAAYQLVQNFEPKDYELMSRLRQSRDISKKFKAADMLLSSLLSRNQQPQHVNSNGKRPSTVPISLGRPFFQPKHVACAKDGTIKILQPHQIHIVRGDASGKRAMKAWEPLVKLLQKPIIMDKLHKFAEEEFEFHKCVEERRLKKEHATRVSQLDNSKFAEKIKLKTHLEKIQYRCSPEGVMEDIRRRNGLLKEDSWWSNRSRRKLAQGLTHKTKKKRRPPPKAESIASVSDGLPDLCFDFDPPDHPGRSPFGHCATNGVAWWENYLIKKPRPSREKLSERPVDVELDTEPLSLRPVEEDLINYQVEPNSLMIPRLQPKNNNKNNNGPRARTTPGNSRAKHVRVKKSSSMQLSTNRRGHNIKQNGHRNRLNNRYSHSVKIQNNHPVQNSRRPSTTSKKFKHNQTV